MNTHDRDIAATLERLYPPVIGGSGWDDVLDRLEQPKPSTVAAISRHRRFSRRSLLAPLAAVLAALAVVGAPALAFSPKVRELVGLATTSTRPPVFIAHVTGVFVHGPDTRPGTLVTIRFVVGQPGKPLGLGIPKGSTFDVLLTRRSGQFAPAYGSNGHYQATVRLGPGRGIGGIQVGAFMPGNGYGSRVINGGFWIPTVIDIGQ